MILESVFLCDCIVCNALSIYLYIHLSIFLYMYSFFSLFFPPTLIPHPCTPSISRYSSPSLSLLFFPSSHPILSFIAAPPHHPPHWTEQFSGRNEERLIAVNRVKYFPDHPSPPSPLHLSPVTPEPACRRELWVMRECVGCAGDCGECLISQQGFRVLK